MPGEGFAFDAIAKLKQNRSMRPSKRSKFRGGRQYKSNYDIQTINKIKHKKLSEKERNEIICRIRQDTKKERNKSIIILLLSIAGFVMILLAFTLLLSWILSK